LADSLLKENLSINCASPSLFTIVFDTRSCPIQAPNVAHSSRKPTRLIPETMASRPEYSRESLQDAATSSQFLERTLPQLPRLVQNTIRQALRTDSSPEAQVTAAQEVYDMVAEFDRRVSEGIRSAAEAVRESAREEARQEFQTAQVPPQPATLSVPDPADTTPGVPTPRTESPQPQVLQTVLPHHRFRKPFTLDEFPEYSGEQKREAAQIWLQTMEATFQSEEDLAGITTTSKQKVLLAARRLKGEAKIIWDSEYRLAQQPNSGLTVPTEWGPFKVWILRNFQENNPTEERWDALASCKMKETDTLRSYIIAFAQVVANYGDLPNDIQVRFFVAGLKPTLLSKWREIPERQRPKQLREIQSLLRDKE
jgi:hypothetical protein